MAVVESMATPERAEDRLGLEPLPKCGNEDILTALYLWMFSSASFRRQQIKEQEASADGQKFLSMHTVQRAMNSDVMLRQAQIFQQGDINRVIEDASFRSERWRSQMAAAWATTGQRESAEAENEA